LSISDLRAGTRRSYFSIFTTSDSDASEAAFNPFDEDTHSSYAATSVESRHISYSSSTGRVTFGTGGEFLVVFDAPVTVSDASTVRGLILVNGSAVYTSEGMASTETIDPRNHTFHTLISVNSGDYLEVQIEQETADEDATAQNGTALTIIEAIGDYGSVLYTADANAAGSGPAEFTLFDSDNGGTVTSKLKNVAFATATGLLTPSNTRKFLMFSSLITEVGTSGDVTHKLYADGSSIDDLPGRVNTGSDPTELSYGFLKELTEDETTSARVIGAGTVTAQQGTAFTIFDFTNEGIEPSAYFSLTVDIDSDDLADGGKTCFRANKWTDYAYTARAGTIDGSTGIIYNETTGRFTVLNAGKYFVLWSLMIGTADSGERTVKVAKNGDDIYTAPFYMHQNHDPMEKTVCLILDLSADDYVTFVIVDGEGDIDAGTAITIFKIDDPDFRQETPASLITTDFTINSFGADTLGKQHDRATRQVPFCLGIPGPMSLRGRGFASTDEPHFVATGDKKN